jgi:beta-1,4-mannosyl-glycoprotein beta-1,4-N-acetylglucosaminyltransferase
MKVYDCITYSNERLLFNLRLNILDKFVDRFIVIEANYSHSGNKKKINFNTNHYPKFKERITHIILKQESPELKFPNKDFKRWNSHKRMEFQRNKIADALTNAGPEDIIMYSDSDEIPNLEKINFKNLKQKVIIFKQKMFYYKFNLYYDLISWFGSKACRIRNLILPSILRHTKTKKYSFWRIDTWFSKVKYSSVKIIENGGWHFTNLKSPEKILEKYLNFGHHNEYEDISVKLEYIQKMIS